MTGLLAVKLRRDLRASWSRFALMVVAVAVSLTAFGAALTAWAGIGRETRGAYLSTEPASATIVLEEGVDATRMRALVAEARRRPGVLAATGRTQFGSRVTVDGAERAVPLQVFVAAADDPMRLARFDLRREGSWPPARGELWLADDSFGLLGAADGDTLGLIGVNGEEVRVRVAGGAYDPSLAPSPQDQTGHGYLSLDTLAATGRPPLLDQLKLQVADPGGSTPSRDRDTVVAVAQDVADRLRDAEGVALAEIQVPEPYAHPHQYQADVLFLSLLLGGTVAFLLSTVLVAIMLGNLFTRQIPEIGVLKVVGARAGSVARLYLSMVLVVAAVATALALPPALLIGRVLLDAVLGMLGIDAVSLAPPWWTVPVVVAVGLGIPPLLALYPLTKASRITVRQAIDHHGTGVTTGPLTRVLTRLGTSRRVNRALVLALRNAVRRPARSLLAVVLLATAGTVFVAGMSLRDSMEAQTAAQNSSRTWDVDVTLAAPARSADVAPMVRQVAGVTGVEAWSLTPTAVAVPGRVPVTRTYPDQGHGRVGITAVPPGTTAPPPALVTGRWLRPGERDAVVLGEVARKNTVPGVEVGDDVQLLLEGRPVTLRVVGVAREREAGGYVTAEGLAAALGRDQESNQLRITTTGHDEQTRADVARAVRDALVANGVRVGVAASVSRAAAAAGGHAGPLVTVFLMIAIAFGVVGGIGLAATMSANVLDRTREFGVLHAIGARPATVRRIVTVEGIVLAVAGCLVAAVPALVLTDVLVTGLGNLFLQMPLPYRISPVGVAAWIVLALLGGALATNAAASGAARITVRQALERG